MHGEELQKYTSPTERGRGTAHSRGMRMRDRRSSPDAPAPARSRRPALRHRPDTVASVCVCMLGCMCSGLLGHARPA